MPMSAEKKLPQIQEDQQGTRPKVITPQNSVPAVEQGGGLIDWLIGGTCAFALTGLKDKEEKA